MLKSIFSRSKAGTVEVVHDPTLEELNRMFWLLCWRSLDGISLERLVFLQENFDQVFRSFPESESNRRVLRKALEDAIFIAEHK